MARIRTIKPDTFTDEKFVSLSPLARLFYIALWCEADREGRLEWQLKTLKWKYLPSDDCDIEAIGKELVDKGRVVRYTCEGKLLALIPTFKTHQHVNTREAPSKLPVPPGTKRVRARATPSPAPDDTSTDQVTAHGEGKGREQEGKENPPKSPKGEKYPEKFLALRKAYPSRGKAADPNKLAFGAYEKALKNGADPDELIRLAPTSAPAEKHGSEFVPQLATWLNQERWKDQPPPAAETCDRMARDDEFWRKTITFWQRTKIWPYNSAGPQFGSGGCEIPAHIISEFNLDGMSQPPFLKRSA